ncbi:hypothetical protein GYMLUDRAFT_238967 [Collybiopsis luxurians FD-317 M1]|nr:hypothetical protein GYMLUDRAFT_238967 [Collybiopsis luxurians FD-317 M1]
MPVPSLTATYHTTTYPAISPTKLSLSQAGKTILITGGGGGIGFEIARSFAKASAARVIIIGRRSGLLDEAVVKLRDEFGTTGPTEFMACQGDISNDESITALWEYLHSQNIFVHVLILNAAHFEPTGPDTLSMDRKKFKQAFDTNVTGNFYMSAKFVQQTTDTAVKRPLFLLNVATSDLHMYPSTNQNPYASSKTAFVALLGRIADERKVDDVQIISFHPGVLYSEAVSKAVDKAKVAKDAIKWDDMSLPADYAVWAASPEASWLHGRFVWAHWDVDEFREAALNRDQNSEIGKRLAEEEGYLKVGVSGLPSFSREAFFNQ